MPAGRKPTPPKPPSGSKKPPFEPYNEKYFESVSKNAVASDLKKLDAALRKVLVKQGITPTSPGYEAARRKQNNDLVAYAMKQAAAKITSSKSPGAGGRKGPQPRTKRGN